ncbi:hypothetical protein S245_021256, partial [Arachis hypogaea]
VPEHDGARINEQTNIIENAKNEPNKMKLDSPLNKAQSKTNLEECLAELE